MPMRSFPKCVTVCCNISMPVTWCSLAAGAEDQHGWGHPCATGSHWQRLPGNLQWPPQPWPNPCPWGLCYFLWKCWLLFCQRMYYLQCRLSFTVGWTWKARSCGNLVSVGRFLLVDLTNSPQVPLKETSQSMMKDALKIC